MDCAPSQCTPNVYWGIISFDNMNCFFKLGLTVREFFYFFEVGRCEKYAQLCVCNAKLFDSLKITHAMECLDREDSSIELSRKRKMALKLSKDEVAPLRVREASPRSLVFLPLW
ncbi:unnamed protein product [Prunus brigantina]